MSGAAPLAAAAAVVAGAGALRALSRWRNRPIGPAVAGVDVAVPTWATEVATVLGVPARELHRAWLAALAVPPLLAVTAGPTLAAASGAALAGAPTLLRRAVRRRADAALDAALPGALDTVARSLRSGASLRQALADAAEAAPGRLADDLRHVVARASAGIPLREALDDWGRTRPRPGILLAVAALGLAVETGGASARAVDGVASTLRRRESVQEEAAALSAQARASALVLAAAPAAVCAVTLAGGGGATAFLLRSPLGTACLVAGLALDALGGWWMARLVRAPAAAPAFATPPSRLSRPSRGVGARAPLAAGLRREAP